MVIFFSGKISFHVLLWELNLSVDKNKFPSETSFFFIEYGTAYTYDTCKQRKVVERVTGLNRKGLYLLFDYGWLGV